MTRIDQQKNYTASFGPVFRSSAIFAVVPEARCTLSVLNYWAIKNGLAVSLVFTERQSDGTLVQRTCVEFNGSHVINYHPTNSSGSVEIEAFGHRNLRIPYAAVMAIYETETSISMVHSYGRNHSAAELEDGNAILEGREGCITVRAAADVQTRTIFHNGNIPVPEQRARLIVSSISGAEREVEFDLPALAPYETAVFDVSELMPDFRTLLGGADGWASLRFSNLSAFPRMLVLWMAKDGTIQATHTNFDYSAFETDEIEATRPAAVALPQLEPALHDLQLVIYPRCATGTYRLGTGGNVALTRGGSVHRLTGGKDCRADVEAVDRNLPSRLVAAVSGKTSEGALPFECSLGIIHERRPPKHFHWAVVDAERTHRIYITGFADLYPCETAIELTLRLYGEKSLEPAERKLHFGAPDAVPAHFRLEHLFPNAGDVLKGNLGYLTLFSNWGGLMMFSSLSKMDSMTVEHSF